MLRWLTGTTPEGLSAAAMAGNLRVADVQEYGDLGVFRVWWNLPHNLISRVPIPRGVVKTFEEAKGQIEKAFEVWLEEATLEFAPQIEE